MIYTRNILGVAEWIQFCKKGNEYVNIVWKFQEDIGTSKLELHVVEFLTQ